MMFLFSSFKVRTSSALQSPRIGRTNMWKNIFCEWDSTEGQLALIYKYFSILFIGPGVGYSTKCP